MRLRSGTCAAIVAISCTLASGPVHAGAPATPATAGGPAPSCPAGTANVGTIAERRICQISGNITGNLVLANLPGVVYSLSGRVNVGIDLGPDPDSPRPGGQQGILTIEPGVVVFGSSTADFLVVDRGSQIFAEGTPTQPIIFTSRSNIERSVGPDSVGEWGGILILGRGPINRCIGPGIPGGSVACESAAEGTTNALFGGASTNDNSGRLGYVQVRFPGFVLTSGNELNGITFAGVGAGTYARHLQVHNSVDDGFEWFGGRVNHKYLVATGAGDDAVDTDFGYKGLVQYLLAIKRATGGDRVLEAETAGGDVFVPRSFPRIANFTFISERDPDAVLLRGGTDFGLVNGIISAIGRTCLDIDGAQTVAAANATLDETGPPIFRSVTFGCAETARDEADVPASQIAPLIAFNNNRFRQSLTLFDTFLPGPDETSAVATNPRSVFSGTGTFFDETTFVGAVNGPGDTWWQGWTCGLGSNALPCTVSPFDGPLVFANGFE